MKFKKTKGSYICSSLTFYVQYFYIIYEFVEHVSYTISFQTLRHSCLAINYIQFFSFSKLQSSSVYEVSLNGFDMYCPSLKLIN